MERPAVTYALAILATLAAIVLRWVLDPILHDALPLVTLFGAVAAAVWVGGYRPALVAALLGYVGCMVLVGAPARGGILFSVQNLVGLVAYLFTCALIIAIGESMRSAQQRSSERGELLRVTLGSIGDAVVATDNAGKITYLNGVAERLMGWAARDAIGQPLEVPFEIFNEQTRQRVENPVARVLREGHTVGLANHTILRAKDGREYPIDDSAAPIKDERGQISGCILIFRDVTERRRWEKDEAARLLAARTLAAIVETSDDAIISKSLEGVIQSWNAAAERLFGYSANEAIGRHISLVIPPERIAEEDQIITNLKAGKRIDHFETERVRKDGARIIVSLTISPIKDSTGKIVGASKIVRDFTLQRQAEAEKQKFATLVESSTDFIGICDLEGVPSYVNPAGLDLIGLSSVEEARTKNIADFFLAEDRARMMNEFLPEVLAEGHGAIDVRFRNFQTGELRWMAYKVLTLVDLAGKTTGFATVSQDITERRRLEDELRKAAADLSDADRRKDEFLATLAHELRNPLAPLRNMLEILKRSGCDEATLSRATSTMERQLGQLVRLVDDLLDLSRITHNRIELRRSRIDLSSIIEQAVQANEPVAKAGQHELTVSLPPGPIYLDADSVRLSQVFGNLLNNSCKYTNPGGAIRISAEQDGHEAVVTISDNGIGIPQEKLESIFEMFSQVDRSLEKSQGGLGIGLTLVKRLVEMHGGTVQARSGGINQGAEFIVRLPILEAGSAMQPPPAPSEATDKSARRILVVDDNQDSANSLALLLQITGNETRTAHDGESALEIIEEYRPAAILLDIGLPTINGYEVCRRVREHSWGKAIVIIALTGWGQDEDRRKSDEAGFDGHLVKPVEYPALVALLNRLMGSLRK